MKKLGMLLIAFVVVALCLFLLPTQARAAEIVNQGNCGYNWDNLQWTLDDEGTLTISGTGRMNSYSQWKGSTAIKKVVIEEGVTDISTSAFDNCDNLTTVIIPDSLTAIYANAFYGCDGLTSISISSGVTTLGDRAFYKCTNLADITLAGNITSLGMEVFSNCNNVQNITITEGVTAIVDNMFAYLTGLKTVTIPSSMSSIGAGVFNGCNKMTGVYITDLAAWCRIDFKNGYSNPVVNAKNLYLNNALLTDMVIPNDITAIKSTAFYNADCLKSVTLPEGMTAIGEYAFLDCENLVSVNIPKSVTSIGSGAFGNCSSLVEVHITDIAAWCAISHYQYENPLSHNSNSYLYINGVPTTDIAIPMGVTEIASYAFYGYKNLNSIILPKGNIIIGQYAFGHTGVQEIVLSNVADGVCIRDTKAFYNCRITNVYHRGSREDWEAVYGTPEDYADVGYGYNLFEGVEVTHEYVSSTHYWDNGVETTAPTCKEAGVKTFTCTVCGDSYTEEIAKLTTHSYNDGVETTAPTCKEAGVKTFTCTVCGDSYTEEIAKLTTHSYDDGVETKAATCKEAGVKTFTCTVCGDSYTEEIAVSTEHSYVDGSCTVCGGSDPDYVEPSDPTDPDVDAPSDPADPDVEKPTEPEDSSKEEPKTFFEAIAAFFEKLFRILFFFLYL